MFEGTVVAACHEEYPVGSIVRSETTENEVGYTWMTIVLSNGVKRAIIVKDVKQVQGESNGKA